VLAHYILERELSDRLRGTPRENRSRVYSEVYEELFASLPDHPQHRSRFQVLNHVGPQVSRLGNGLHRDSVFLEIGCGDAALAFAMAGRVRKAYGLDVTDALIDFGSLPPNFSFLRTGGVEIPLPSGEVDFAYSNQLMEHLHPDDAADQLTEVYRVLKSGGCYMCITPSRVTGPHDVSCYFDYEATGFHLREYDYGVLQALFRKAGFQNFSCSASIKGREIRVPYFAVRAAERGLLLLPPHVRASLTSSHVVQAILGLTASAVK